MNRNPYQSATGAEALSSVYVQMQGMNWTEQSQGWVCLLRGQRLQAHYLVPEGSGRNL